MKYLRIELPELLALAGPGLSMKLKNRPSSGKEEKRIFPIRFLRRRDNRIYKKFRFPRRGKKLTVFKKPAMVAAVGRQGGIGPLDPSFSVLAAAARSKSAFSAVSVVE